MLRDPLAWHVTLYMGSQSALAYIVLSWLPTILTDRGLIAVTAGLTLSFSILAQTIGAVGGPWLGNHLASERLPIAAAIVLATAGFCGCVLAPLGTLWLWAVLLGIGLGSAFSLALTLLTLRAPDTTRASQLSAMAQGFGYLLAAAGPLAAGVMRDAFGKWTSTAVMYVVVALVALVSGLAAGRNKLILS